MLSERFVPAVTARNQEFFDHARRGVLSLQTCGTCGERWYLPSSHCPACAGTDLAWIPASGRATLWSWITMHQNYLPAFAGETPYDVAFVVLEEGVELISGLVGTDRSELRIDLPLVVEFQPVGPDGLPMPFFRPDAG